MKREIHSFPTMYIMWGGKWDQNGSRLRFSEKKSGQKTAFLRDTNSELTLGGSETHIFEGIANFSMCFENSGTLSSK